MSSAKIIEKNRKIEAELIACILPMIDSQEYTDISIREICERIGITTGKFYRHFRTKTDLLTICVDQKTTHLLDEIEGELGGKALDEQLKLLTLAAFKASLMLGPDGIIRFFNGDSKDPVGSCRVSRGILVDRITNCIHRNRPDLDTEAQRIADALVVLLKGVSFEWYTKAHEGNKSFDPVVCLEEMLDYCLPSLLKRRQ
jgi:AcrR family transcriptional regulator